MRDPERDFWLEDDEEDQPKSQHDYDPIVTPWDEAGDDAPVSLSGADSAHDPWSAYESPSEEQAFQAGWGASYPGPHASGRMDAGSAYGANHGGYASAAAAMPITTTTELQRVLRNETVTIPRVRSRWQGIGLALFGLLILLAGWAVTITDVADSSYLVIAYATIIGGGVLALAGGMFAALEMPVPYPSVSSTREVAETLLLAALIFLAVRASFQNFRVEGHSMDPSLEHGEYLIVNKLTYAQIDLGMFDFLPFFDAGDDPIHYLWGKPARGDVVVFRAPTSPDRDFIKRIIGLPGDTVQIDQASGTVSVNGAPLTEYYIMGSTSCSQSCTWTVPKANTEESRQSCGSNACYFVLGDNRQNSSDSRQGWLVPRENIVGKALVTYWHQGGPELDLAPNHSVGIVGEASAEE